MLRFYGSSERDSFGRGQRSSNRVSGISTRTMHQSTTPSLSQTIWPRWASRQFLSLPIVQTLLPVTFGYSLSSEAVVMRQLRRWARLWRRSLTRSHKRTSMAPSRNCWNGTSALQRGLRVLYVYYQWKCPYEKSLETYLMILVSFWWLTNNVVSMCWSQEENISWEFVLISQAVLSMSCSSCAESLWDGTWVVVQLFSFSFFLFCLAGYYFQGE